jgi:hypothetical protein
MVVGVFGVLEEGVEDVPAMVEREALEGGG